MIRFKKILIISLVGYLLFPAIAMAASCCVCVQQSADLGAGGFNYDWESGQVFTDITDDIDSKCSETKRDAVMFGGLTPFICAIKDNTRCSPAAVTTKLEEDFKFSDVVLGIKIPNLSFSAPPTEIDSEGNIYIPWIGEYIKALYNFALIAISVIAVVVLIIQGVRIIISAGGPEKSAAYKGIAGAVIGLFIAWGSYVILYSIDPNLTQFKSLKIKFIETEYLEEPADDIEQTTTVLSSQIIKKADKTGRNDCLKEILLETASISLKKNFPDLIGKSPNHPKPQGARSVTINKLMYNDLMAVLSEILQSTDYKIKAIGGIRGTSGVCNSNNLHLCGLAVDINPGDNPDCPAYIKKNDRQVGQFWDVAGDHKITQTEWDLCNKGGQVTNIPQKVIDIFEKHGFYWGGYGWGNPNRSDAMHFEYHKYCYE